MRDSRLEELISAYLDGEVSSDERAFVERQLAESAESRQYLEQLKQQQLLLRTLGRRTASPDMAARVLDRLAAAGSQAPALRTAAGANRSKAAGHRGAWRILLGVVTTLAAGLLIAVVIHDSGRQLAPKEGGVGEPLVVDPVALEKFQQQFPFVTILDVSITPQGQTQQVVEKSLAAAGIAMERSVALDDRLEQGILDSRFIGDQGVVAGSSSPPTAKDEIEMVFLRGPAIQLDNFFRDLLVHQATGQTVAGLRMDLAQATKELAVFLQLNDALAPEAKTIVARAETWKQPGAYRLRFRLALHSLSLSRLSAIAGSIVQAEFVPADDGNSTRLPGAAADAAPGGPRTKGAPGVAETRPAGQPAPVPPADPGNDPNQPSQMLLIVRNLK